MITQVNLLNNVMIVFQVSLNFDSVKEILKKAMQVKMKTSAPLFFSHFSSRLNKKKTCEKKNCKNEGRVIDCLCC